MSTSLSAISVERKGAIWRESSQKGQRVGYARVSSVDQNVDRQLEQLDCDRVFIDYVSGKDVRRPQLKEMLDYVRDGDTIVVASMDRLARNLDDLRKLVNEQTWRGVRVQFLKEHMTFTGQDSSMSKLMLSILGSVAEFERAIIKERQAEGIALAKGRGVYRGRKYALTTQQTSEALTRIATGESKAKVARDLHISRETLYQSLRRIESDNRVES